MLETINLERAYGQLSTNTVSAFRCPSCF